MAAPATEDAEEFAHVHFEPNRYGHATFNGTNYFFGIFAMSTGADDPELYEMLQEGSPIEGVPGRTPVESASDAPMDWFGEMEKNIWAALNESEGSLQALNTYDTAFLSVGPVQQTAGAGEAKGELQGALDTLREHAPDTYWRHLGRFGLKPVGATIQGGAKKAHVELNGEVLDSAEKKERLRRFKWAWLFQRAMQNPTVRYWVMREGFERLDRIREREFTLQVPVEEREEPYEFDATIGDIFSRDLSQALLLDTHVNQPYDIWSADRDVNIWLGAIEEKLTGWDVTSADNLPLTETQELELVALLMEARIGEMSGPARRAIDILAYTSRQVVQNLATENQASHQSQTVPAFLSRILNLENNDDYTGQGAWNSIRNQERQVLSFTFQ